MSSQEAEQNWQEDVFRVLKAHDVKHVVFVPDAGHSASIRMSYADPDIKAVVLTTEEEGIGYLERETFDAFLQLPAPQRKLIREVILTFAQMHSAQPHTPQAAPD